MGDFKWKHLQGEIIIGCVRWYCKCGTCYRDLDETYVKVKDQWKYLYRAIIKRGHTIDFYLSSTQNGKAAKRFLGKVLRKLKEYQKPDTINVDLAPSYGRAIRKLKKEGLLHKELLHRKVK